ncbi:MAG: hypothetical protein N2039_04350 [Gemmataceae bacterium]|nr:hypothetical protein [Gemmataceae bacterium]
MQRLAAMVMVLGLATAGFADSKNDPTGTWKWEVERQGQRREMTLKLKLEGDKLTGSMPGRQGRETPIEEGTFKDGKVSFTITREMQGNKIVTKYSGTVEGDTLKLKVETERNGQTRTSEIEAKRVKD